MPASFRYHGPQVEKEDFKMFIPTPDIACQPYTPTLKGTVTYGPCHKKTKLPWGGGDQQRRRPACASAQSDQSLNCSLIGKHHIKICYNQISLFYLVSVAEETCVSLVLSETLKTGFVASRPISFTCNSFHSGETGILAKCKDPDEMPHNTAFQHFGSLVAQW